MITGKNTYVPLAPKANKEGFLAGINICGGKEEYPGILGTAITKFYDLGIGRTGLTLDEAEKNGFNPVKYQLSSMSRAKYYPGSEKINSIIIASKDNGRILGAQLTGPLDSVKRIDVYSTMIYNKMTVKDAFNLDLAYAPPFSPVYDPVLLAARVGRKHV
jgi:CoA-dependent NAD(P)H sulfur oxidoreductase